MNYPVWELFSAGGGLPIALMAIVHVFVAHFAVGGGLFLVMTERKAYRENSKAILDYTKKHAKFFLLLTMVFGGLTGVGIWFTISVLSPGATSVLIHNFLYGWATEWVFFVVEIVALFVYFYTFGKMDQQRHLAVGWIYFISAWMSLFLINGIIAFMLTPGGWLESGSFWQGFFNPTFWPSLVFRTFLAIVLAGVFGFVTATFIKDQTARAKLVRYNARWLLVPMLFLVASGWWYLQAVPEPAREIILDRSPELIPYFKAFIWLSVVIFLGGVLLAVRGARRWQRPLAFVLMAVALAYMGSFEYLRESGRHPYLIYDYMYSNGILTSQEETINAQGFLSTAKWTEYDTVTPENRLAVGRELFRMQCMSCHAVDGPHNDILPLTAKYDVYGMDSQLDGLGKLNDYMPRFMGTKAERKALAAFIVRDLHGKEPAASSDTPMQVKQREPEIPPFDPETDEYVLLAWNNLGMHCISDSSDWWVLLPPANDLFAQLIRRGPVPEVVTEGVELEYAVEEGFENPSEHVPFWENVESLFGTQLEDNVGLSGKGMQGQMDLAEDLSAFEAPLVPVVPYPDEGGYMPYPLFHITAKDKDSGEVLAKTSMVAPTSTEMGCKNCHGGEWRVDDKAGFTDATSMDILATHDKNNRTNLLESARKGEPKLCQSCHPDPVLGTEENPEYPNIMNFPAAIHGWHANYLTDRGAESCNKCHPSSATGPTGCLRGVHEGVGLDCTSCHGTLEDHALSLLKKEQRAGKKSAERMMAHLEPNVVESVEHIRPRTPWVNEPDCLNCHVDFGKPKSKDVSGFNKWTSGQEDLFRMRHEETGSIMCEACHGSTHANYPARNMYGKNLDNIQPQQYQGNALPISANKNCAVCHTMDMGFDMHHPNIYRDFRNTQLLEDGDGS
ncbi:MAG: cytochrome ubiquinol oxidase subunit I [Desulfohalobium sp.]